MKLFERWRSSTDAARFESYTWWSIVVLLWCVPLLTLSAAGAATEGIDGPTTTPVLHLTAGTQMLLMTLLGVAVSATSVRVVRDSFDIRLGRGGGSRANLVALLVAGSATCGAALLTLPITNDWPVGAGFVTAVVITVVLAAVGARWSARGLGRMIVPATVLSMLAHLPVPGTPLGYHIVMHIPNLFVIGGFAFSVWLSAWMIQVVRRLEEARDVEGRLAVAEERLRFSRDLHDTVGRSLSAIAVKSELAAELARRGRPEAVTEMSAVRDLAHESLAEVRSVAAGYRRVSLADELDGARSLLRSTGAVTTITGDADGVGPRAQEVLAWAVREGVTNVVRHSSARTVSLDLAREGDDAVLTLRNDAATAGARTPDQPSGSGLTGLNERVSRVGGTVRTEREGEEFVLRVTVPARLPADAAAVPPPDSSAGVPADAAVPPTDGSAGLPADAAGPPTGAVADPSVRPVPSHHAPEVTP